MYQLQRVIQLFFLAPLFSFNFRASQLYFEGLSFLSPLLCALCCFRGCQRTPGFAIALGRQAGSAILLVHLNQFVSCSGFSPLSLHIPSKPWSCCFQTVPSNVTHTPVQYLECSCSLGRAEMHPLLWASHGGRGRIRLGSASFRYPHCQVQAKDMQSTST